MKYILYTSLLNCNKPLNNLYKIYIYILKEKDKYKKNNKIVWLWYFMMKICYIGI